MNLVRAILVLLTVILLQNANGQENKDTLVSLDEPKYSRDSLLNLAFENWYRKSFYPILKKYGIRKISCGSCYGCWLEVDFHTDSTGVPDAVVYVDGKKCGEQMPEKLKKEMIRSLVHLRLPPAYSNGHYRKRLGRVLKC